MRVLAAGASLTALLLLSPSSPMAEVVDVADHGFTVRTQLEVVATPARVFTALTEQIDRWWHPDHTFGGDAAHLYLEARAGGIFGEKLPRGGSVRHLEVLYVDPGRLLRLGGGLGPLQGMAVDGAMTVMVEPSAVGTRLTLTYAVGGYAPGGLAEFAAPVDAVLAEQMERLKAHAEG